ncbi:MAG TPA: alpha/beta fold hydrolase [Stellaceae bacterium]|jgi:pimeloyl-ACP methyl ester carboxylesterase|nr:alpha/beta fold hydrolase [Stellaceae bacterium]
MPPEPQIVKIGDVGVSLRRAGKGPPLLFLHGADGYSQWLPFFDALAEQYELLVPEHPGFGASDDPPLIRSVSDMAMFYLDFLEALELRDIHIVGHSLGGWIAAEILIRDQSRAKSLTLISAAGIRVEGVPSGDIFIWNREELLRNVFYNQAYADIALSLQLTEQQLDTMLKNRFTATKLGWQPRWYNPDLEKWLHRIKLPALIIWGDEDKVMPADYAGLWRERLPDARLVMIEKCGHVPQIEKLSETIDPLRDFLAEVSR